jgi:hypothetical protein
MKKIFSGILIVTFGLLFIKCNNPVTPDSDNADLSSLTVDNGSLSPVFISTTTAYTVSVPDTVDSIMVIGIKADINASISINPTQPSLLTVGSNTITVTVSAQSGVVKVYTVTVTRAAPLTYHLTLYTDHGTTIPSGTISVSPDIGTAIDVTYDPAWYFSLWVVSTGIAYFDGDPTHSTSLLNSTIVTLTSGDASIYAMPTDIAP